MKDIAWTTYKEGEHWTTEVLFRMHSLQPLAIDGQRLESALDEAVAATATWRAWCIWRLARKAMKED